MFRFQTPVVLSFEASAANAGAPSATPSKARKQAAVLLFMDFPVATERLWMWRPVIGDKGYHGAGAAIQTV